MLDDVAILLEWLNANGITDFFNDVPFNRVEEKIKIIDNTNLGKKSFDEIIKNLSEKQNNMELTYIDKIDFIQKSRNLCNNLNSINLMEDAIENFEGFNNIKNTATNTIFYSGNCNSNILIINDFPTENDDISGKIFSGESEELIIKMLKSIDIEYNNCCLVNSFFWRLAGNRIPIKEEFDLCKPFVEKFISLIEPKLIIFVGNYAISNLTNVFNTIAKTRGKFFEYTNEYLYSNLNATSIFGPNFLIKNQNKKRDTWNDLLMIKDFLNEHNCIC